MFWRNGPLNDSLTIYYSVDGTATADTDYEELAGFVVLPENVSAVSILVDPLDNAGAEAIETVEVTIDPDSAYLIGPWSSDIVSIIDNDTTVTVAATDDDADEDGEDEAVFTISRSGDTTDDLRVYYTFGGDALAGYDYSYTGLGWYVTIPAGYSSTTLTVSNGPVRTNAVLFGVRFGDTTREG